MRPLEGAVVWRGGDGGGGTHEGNEEALGEESLVDEGDEVVGVAEDAVVDVELRQLRPVHDQPRLRLHLAQPHQHVVPRHVLQHPTLQLPIPAPSPVALPIGGKEGVTLRAER